MLINTIVKLTGYLICWNYNHRLAYRNTIKTQLLRFKYFVFKIKHTVVAGTNGNTLEKQVIVLGKVVHSYHYTRTRIRIALLVDEFFGGWNTPIGGYGALARKYICKYIPNDNIQIDVLLDTSGGEKTKTKLVDNTMLHRLPSHPLQRQCWLDRQAYNLFISIEMTEPSFRILSNYHNDTTLLYWVQDPRQLDLYQKRRLSVTRLQDSDWSYLEAVIPWIANLIEKRQVSFISQGNSLSEIVSTMYPVNAKQIKNLVNPVDLDMDYSIKQQKENKIIFLGRLEAQKRAWIACEIAKSMPEFQFYILGATGIGRSETENARSLAEYRNPDGRSKIKNLHFVGHVDGDIKTQYIKTAKLLINTSIWEGIPVSWLEALSYGTLIVSAFDRDNIVSRFGTFIGEIPGDGTRAEDIEKFSSAITAWMFADDKRNKTAMEAITFIRQHHSVSSFVSNLRAEIHLNIK